VVPHLCERPISSLTYEELEEICEIADESARKYIFTRVKREYISDLRISIDLESLNSLEVNVEVEIELSPLCKKFNVQEIAEGSVKAAFEAIEKHLEEIRCKKTLRDKGD